MAVLLLPFSDVLSQAYQPALVLTFLKYLCRTRRRLKTHSCFFSARTTSDLSHFCWTGDVESWDWIKRLFISFYCIFTCWLESCEKRKLISLKDGVWNVCLRTAGWFATVTWVWLDIYVFTMRAGVGLRTRVCALSHVQSLWKNLKTFED